MSKWSSEQHSLETAVKIQTEECLGFCPSLEVYPLSAGVYLLTHSLYQVKLI